MLPFVKLFVFVGTFYFSTSPGACLTLYCSLVCLVDTLNQSWTSAVYSGAALQHHLSNKTRASLHDGFEQGTYTGGVHSRIYDKESLF